MTTTGSPAGGDGARARLNADGGPVRGHDHKGVIRVGGGEGDVGQAERGQFLLHDFTVASSDGRSRDLSRNRGGRCGRGGDLRCQCRDRSGGRCSGGGLVVVAAASEAGDDGGERAQAKVEYEAFLATCPSRQLLDRICDKWGRWS